LSGQVIVREEGRHCFDFRNLQSTIWNLEWSGPLAQMEEHLIFNPVAAGSNPARPNGIVDSRLKIAD
jgi:hypothetical protein